MKVFYITQVFLVAALFSLLCKNKEEEEDDDDSDEARLSLAADEEWLHQDAINGGMILTFPYF